MGTHVHAPAESGHGARRPDGLTRMAVVATLHCLLGCAVGETLGLVLGGALGLPGTATVALAVGLAFLTGYGFTAVPVLRAGMGVRAALALAPAADTVSVAVMEVADNAVMLLMPGAMAAGPADPLFFGALASAFTVAFAVTVPVNRALMARGLGHARFHAHHG